jgi:hypothetical protein
MLARRRQSSAERARRATFLTTFLTVSHMPSKRLRVTTKSCLKVLQADC